MSMTDPIADMLTCIRNANSVKKAYVDVPFSAIKQEIVKVMAEEGFIKEYRVIENDKNGILRIFLKYTPDGNPVIRGLKRISKPGCRVYKKIKEMGLILDGVGVAILSTSQGIMSDREARKKNTGGEVICHIW